MLDGMQDTKSETQANPKQAYVPPTNLTSGVAVTDVAGSKYDANKTQVLSVYAITA